MDPLGYASEGPGKEGNDQRYAGRMRRNIISSVVLQAPLIALELCRSCRMVFDVLGFTWELWRELWRELCRILWRLVGESVRERSMYPGNLHLDHVLMFQLMCTQCLGGA